MSNLCMDAIGNESFVFLEPVCLVTYLSSKMPYVVLNWYAILHLAFLIFLIFLYNDEMHNKMQ